MSIPETFTQLETAHRSKYPNANVNFSESPLIPDHLFFTRRADN